eukprot:CAMPEP_0174969612 /NCGR_PEP_ID=MMETSP0004_2-20121128/8872_1 /TAXON_ID=420556 /ORGANISM="Ochromonas sp., Strain CCMP1393" /LENGTH=724 /DNA_ID=CAMNT_0016219147 /DNA_START=355 /DNA_END=2529 /DNA_ORIENTATION=+
MIAKSFYSSAVQSNISPRISGLKPQVREISFLNNFVAQRRVNRLKKQMDESPGESTLLEYLKAVAEVNPKEVCVYLERGWSSGVIPVNEAFMKEYFKAVGKMNRFDRINISHLLALLARSEAGTALKNGSADGSKLSPQAIAELLAKASGGASGGALGGGGGGGSFGAGSSPTDPLYVTRQDSNWKSQAWSTVRSLLFFFFLASFAGTFFDEARPNGGPAGAGGGIGARLGMGSVVHRAETSDRTFDDVVGIDEAKGDLQEIVMYLRNPQKFTRLGGKLPKGVLLTGPPGTGKTLLARAIAGEAKVPFFHASGSEFEEMYVGVGAKRVRELFDAAKQKSPSIIFIDEIDAIGGSRNLKDQTAMKMTLNQLLVEMDGFQQNNGVIVIAATNFPDSLDSALVRPGRFDKHVDVPMPDIAGRKAILDLYAKKIPLDKDVDMEQLARGTPGFSGAELFNLMNQAALKASVDNLNKVGMAALEYAKDKIMMGSERKSAVISVETMKMTAFHEAGHAIVAIKTEGADPVHKATIMPRGRALGMVMQLPDGDQTSMSRQQMLARLDVCMGGRVAEELVFGHDNVTSGASNDLQQATRLAKAMVTKYGLSEKVGVVFIDDKGKNSGNTQKEVDDEVKALLTDSYKRAKQLLETHRKELDLLAAGLQKYESLAGGEIVDIMAGKNILAGGKRSQRPSRAAQPIPPARASATTTSSSASASGAKAVGASSSRHA